MAEEIVTEKLTTKISRCKLRRRLAKSGCCHRCLGRYEPFLDVACGPEEERKIESNGYLENGAVGAGSIKTKANGAGSLEIESNGVGSHDEVNGTAGGENDSLCYVCLDILGEPELKRMTSFVRDKVKSANYESAHFVLSLVTVQIIEIRQILLALWLKEEFPALEVNAFMDHSLPVKQLLKDDLVSTLPEMLRLEYRTNSAFDVKLEIEVADSRFFQTLEELDPDAFVMRTKRQRRAKKLLSQIFSRKSVLAFFSRHSTETLRGRFPFPTDASEKNKPPSSPSGEAGLFVYHLSLEHEPIFIGGRYNKYVRDLPQTPWIVEGVRLKESSIEEVIVGPIKERLDADEFKFSSSGREDVDVRCLGEGRPFVVEILNPRRIALTEAELRQLETKINASFGEKIRVASMAMVSERETAYLRKMENEKSKHYAAECYSVEKLTELDMDKLRAVRDLLIHQKTPIRYVHCVVAVLLSSL